MAQQKINARDLILQVESSTPSTWLGIGNLNSIVPNFAESEEEADTTVFEDQGEAAHEKMQRGASMTLQGFKTLDSVSGAADPGQERCEFMATQKGAASLGRVRFRHPLSTTWKIWTCSFSHGEEGGGNNAKVPWNMTIKKSGAATTAAV
ncbi:hypothetical protein SUDANB95_05520 [Actinosynnema sp. ALI-1.44]